MSGVKSYNAEELLALGEPTSQMMHAILPDCGIGLLVGKPKTFKSMFALDLCLSIAKGRKFLERFATTKHPTLYITHEVKENCVGSRLRKMGLECDDTLNVCTDPAIRKLENLNTLIQTTAARLVVIDTLQKFCTTIEINSYDSVVRHLVPLRELAHKTNSFLLFVHHTNKSERGDLPKSQQIIGSTALHGECDAIIYLERVEEEGPVEISFEYRDMESTDKGSLQLDPDTLRLSDVGNAIVHPE